MKPLIELNDGETLLIETQPKKEVIIYWLIGRLLLRLVLLPFVVSGFLLQFYPAGFQRVPTVGFIAIFVIAVIIAYYWLSLMRKKHWYFITSERCINFSGLWGINKQMIFFRNIVDVNISQDLIEKMLGISSVIVVVPGSTLASRRLRNRIIFAGLTPEFAEKISYLIGEQMRAARKK